MKFGYHIKSFSVAALFMAAAMQTTPAFATTADEENNITVYRERNKGVVHITSIVMNYDVFLRPLPSGGIGSGVVVDKKGRIVTNNHVIQNSQQLEVTLYDGSKWKATLKGTDPLSDLAIIVIDAPPDKLYPIPMGDSSNLMVGQKVLAIGNPFGLHGTLTTGIISSLGRSLQTEDGRTIDNVIQIDAAINPGNSGGPLLDTNGEIIGINTAIFSLSGGNIGIGFAVPVSMLKKAVPQLIANGYVSHTYLGVRMYPLFPEFAKVMGMKMDVDRGVVVASVGYGTPADQAGIVGGNRQVRVGNTNVPVGGDVIVEVEGKTVKTPQQVVSILSAKKVGDKVKMKLWRKGKYRTVTVTLGERPR